jgi:hypothetical protein
MAAPPPDAARLAAEADALARWAALCAVADEHDRRMRWGRVVRLDEAGARGQNTRPPASTRLRGADGRFWT